MVKAVERGGRIPLSINILSFNCWGLKYIAKYRRERLQEIGNAIVSTVPTPEIVGLQECWTQEDYLVIRKQTRHILPYGKFYYSGIFGGGLAILSKWPIVESNMVRYPLNGRPTAFFRGDWFVGKGVACASIQVGPGRENIFEVFCTHLHAPYEKESADSYMCHRTAQAWEIARLMRGAAERGHPVIGMGDFNIIPSSLAYRLIMTHAAVQDVWKVLHPDSSVAAANHPAEKNRRKATPNARYNLHENGTTCDSALNTWRWTKEQQKMLFKGGNITMDPMTSDPRAKRLDYIFFGNGLDGGSSPPRWRVDSARVGMTDRHPTLNCSLSDHFSVEATISRRPCTEISRSDTLGNRSSTHEQTNDAALRSLTSQSLHPTLYTSYNASPTSSILPLPLARTPSPPDPKATHEWPISSPSYLPPSTYQDILELISTYTSRERRQRRFRLAHFIAAVLVSIICFIAIWWSNHAGVSFMLVFISTLSFGGGVLDGLIGGLFVGSELRALKEFEWEITMTKERAERSEGAGGDTVEREPFSSETNDNTAHQAGRMNHGRNLEYTQAGEKTEKELWEKVRSSQEYGGKENARRGSIRMM
ncbi:MAG: hypothetical protein Q9220_007473 [cf. Caloplaca sp. 1 TL-2023]